MRRCKSEQELQCYGRAASRYHKQDTQDLFAFAFVSHFASAIRLLHCPNFVRY